MRLFALSVLTAVLLVVHGSIATAAPAPAEPGSLVLTEALPHHLWIPGTATAQRITYRTTGVGDAPQLSSGAVYLPPGPEPAGGWPVVAWAHGTVGMADDCAPSVVGPVMAKRDFDFLSGWLHAGYAIAATDYAGLGTPGPLAYLNGRVAAHNVVDSVRAARAAQPALSNKWIVVGQSQGGGAAITTARYATEFGGPGLDFRGGLGTGVPANIESVLQTLGPNVPPIPLTASVTTYVLYILAGLRTSEPNLDIDSLLTPAGKERLDRTEQLCLPKAEPYNEGVALGSLFAKPMSSIPDVYRVLNEYMGVPTSGYDRPIFLGQGVRDTDVPAPSALSLAAQLAANHEPVTLRVYTTAHSTTVPAALPDELAFAAALMK